MRVPPEVIEFLKRGEGMVVFPEGTYYRNVMGPGQLGMVRLTRSRSRLTLPFIPVGIRYFRKGWRTLVHVQFGEAIYSEPDISTKTLLDRAMKEIARLSGL